MIAPIIARRIARNDPIGVTLQALLDDLARAIPGVSCAVLLFRNSSLESAASVGVAPPLLGELCATRTALARRQVVQGFQFHPLISGATEFLGILAIAFATETATPEWEQMVLAYQAMASLAIEHANLIEELTWKAQHDGLTNLGNRAAFEECLVASLKRSRADGGFTGLISINIDRFRLFNEVLGNEVGDAILRHVARRFAIAMEEAGTITRTGGDEFQVILAGLASPTFALLHAQNLASALNHTFEIGDHELTITASIGVAVSSPMIGSPKEIESNGHAAVQRAKRSGGNCVVVFDTSMTSTPTERLNLEQNLRVAIRNRELLVHYQPQIHLETGKLVGTEALLRWHHPKLGLVSPAHFIAIAEESGMIGTLAHWLMHQAVSQHKEWLAAGLPPMRLGLNVSPMQFASPTFAVDFLAMIGELAMDPSFLELEITEMSIMHDLPLTRQHMNRLRGEGVAFSLDDFGTGHSNLAYLRDLPVQCLKIDREFLIPIRCATDRPALLETMISLGHALEVRTIAEGVETKVQAEALRVMGCQEGQGFLYSRPLPGRELFDWAMRWSAPACPAMELA